MSAAVMEIDDIPQVAVDSMNRTHREEVELANALGGLLRRSPGETDAIDQALDRWIAHTEAHFERENRLMEEHGFPPYPVHAQEHATVLAELHALRDRWRESREPEPLAEFVLEQWPRWFTMHVNTMDTITAQFLSSFID